MKSFITNITAIVKRVPEVAKSIVAGAGAVLTAVTALEHSANVDVIPVTWQPYITFGLAILTAVATWSVKNTPKKPTP